MYIVKNAFKCIGRSLGRNILIGIIVLVIATSCCLGLSIRQAAENAKEEELANLSVTATIDFDRSSLMNNMKESNENENADELNGGQPSFDRSEFKEMMGNFSSLSLEEYETYAKAESVDDFYYSMSVSVNGSDDFEPVSTTETSDSSSDTTTEGTIPQDNFGGKMDDMGGDRSRMMGSDSDFTVVGYSDENAMTSFANGETTIAEGSIFEEGTDEYVCVISQELATYNDLAVGDNIIITNPNQEDEEYSLEIVGLYSDTSANSNSFSMMGSTSTDPANQIFVSYNTLQSIVDTSATVSETTTDSDTGAEFETGLKGTLTGTYVFEDADSYYEFEEEVRELGLDDSYTVSSTDITSYENSLVPLETLSTMAGTFLIVILAIGAIILIVFNIFNVRERKYEIGVLTAMGMKKGKVALQFITEIFAVTMVAVIIGIGIGAVSSVPVTNALLENQVFSQQSNLQQKEANFGRGGDMQDMGGNIPDNGDMSNDGDKGFAGFMDKFNGENISNYVTEINSAMNFTVVWQMLLIAVALTLVSGLASMLFVMRYEPLRILANRD